jgi:uncharacterized repeat protein (TIGR01451 family)
MIVMASEDDGKPTEHTPTAGPIAERLGTIGSDPAADKRAARLRHTFDAGEFYTYQGERMPLLRSLTEFVIEFHQGTSEQRKQAIIDSTLLDAKLVGAGRVRGRPVARVELAEPLTKGTLENALSVMRGKSEVKYAFPVFVHPKNGGIAALTDELIVKLRPDAEITHVVSAIGKDKVIPVKQIWGTEDEYILQVKEPKLISPLQLANQLSGSPQVTWATPNLIQEIILAYTPSDDLYPNQWHLNNEGGVEAYFKTVAGTSYSIDIEVDSPADADVDAPEAWDLEQGNAETVIGIIDTGVDLVHEDLVDNLFTNEGEIPDNGIDDDGNGFIDDVHGWDFYANDNEPSYNEPINNEPNDWYYGHGTPVAGIAAARGDNAMGVSGICPRCSFLPVSIMDPDDAENAIDEASVAEAIRYTASFADVLNGSWGAAYPVEVITSALQDVTAFSRDGKGVISMFASMNFASALRYNGGWTPPGTHRYRFTYSKDEEGSGGDDTVWLAWVVTPDGEFMTVEDGMPDNWQTSGDVPWSVVEDALHSDESVCLTHALKAGEIGDGEQSHLDIIVEHEKQGLTWFSYWRSSECPGDKFEVFLDRWNDGTIDEYLGYDCHAPVVKFDVHYPASLPETVAVGASSSWDCRSGYSQFGSNLDFLAPSSGSRLTTPITTTDITGEEGYDDTNYTVFFGGTSAASPLAAGIAGLILSAAPELTAEEVRQLLRETADKIGPEAYLDGRNDRYGYGRVNAHRALAAVIGDQETADLVLTKTAEDEKARLREELEYSITVTNGGPAEATNVRVKDTLPQEVTLEEASDDCAMDQGTLVCSAASIPAGESEAFEFEVIVSRVPEDRLLINQATVTADQADVNLSNNSAEAVTQVIGGMSRRESDDKPGRGHAHGRKSDRPD